MTNYNLDAAAHVVQLALTPVFLLSATATLLNVFAARLARVADRVDSLAQQTKDPFRDELLSLLRSRSRVLCCRHFERPLRSANLCGGIGSVCGRAARDNSGEVFISNFRGRVGVDGSGLGRLCDRDVAGCGHRATDCGQKRRALSLTAPLRQGECRRAVPAAVLLNMVIFGCGKSHAQMPFYTDDPSTTEERQVHIELFEEADGLQSSRYPDLRQYTTNLKINFSPLSHLELDMDAPYIDISRATLVPSSHGMGDADLGAKYTVRETPEGSNLTALAVSLYVELPTGSAREGLGSGLTDYWLNFIAQKPRSDTTRCNVNVGILFAGNTSTGAVGIQTRRGQVYTGGLSVLHDVDSKVRKSLWASNSTAAFRMAPGLIDRNCKRWPGFNI